MATVQEIYPIDEAVCCCAGTSQAGGIFAERSYRDRQEPGGREEGSCDR